MKMVFLMILCLQVGCANRPSMEVLENQALASGDWSEVEQREELLAKRKSNVGLDCPANKTTVCYDGVTSVRCECIASRGRSSF